MVREHSFPLPPARTHARLARKLFVLFLFHFVVWIARLFLCDRWSLLSTRSVGFRVRVRSTGVTCARDLGERADQRAMAAAANVNLTRSLNSFTLSSQGPIHPRTKKPVGMRLAQVAMPLVYGAQTVGTGPTIAGCSVDSNKVNTRTHLPLVRSACVMRPCGGRAWPMGCPGGYMPRNRLGVGGVGLAMSLALSGFVWPMR